MRPSLRFSVIFSRSSQRRSLNESQLAWVQRWFWRASFGQHYGSGGSTKMAKDKILFDQLSNDRLSSGDRRPVPSMQRQARAAHPSDTRRPNRATTAPPKAHREPFPAAPLLLTTHASRRIPAARLHNARPPTYKTGLPSQDSVRYPR